MAEQQWQPVSAGRATMTLRERWVRTMHFQKADYLPNFEFGYWKETLPEWHKQGLPESVDNQARAYAYFGIEGWRGSPVAVGMRPGFETKVVEETDRYVILRDSSGALRRELTDGIRTIPQYLEYAVKNRNDWDRMKERFDPATPDRYPDDWAEKVEEYRNRDYPLCIGIGSLIGWIRDWVGFENLGLMVYDDPEMIEDMIETICACVCGTIERALTEVEFDFGAGWEDICFKNGPIISPRMFDQWIVPRYKRITDLLHDHGVDIAWTDCDGNINAIMDQFLAGGINCMFPIEVAAGSDPVKLREKYGHRVLLHGGVDKMALRAGPKATEKELLRLKPIVDDGAFIPHVDHRCPADVTLENYKFYMKIKREMFNAGDLVPHYDE